MSTFVTFDLDYWTMTEPFNSAHTDYLMTLIHQAKQFRVVKLHHHVVTRHMIPKNTDHVINIDFHNDIVDNCPRSELNEGTWGNFLPKQTKRFTWVYPDWKRCIKRRGGVCIGDDGNTRPQISHVQYEEILKYENVAIVDINKFVVCVSECWAEHDLSPYYKFLNKQKGICV